MLGFFDFFFSALMILMWESSSISIGNFVSGDTLSFINTVNITGSYNSATGVLTLTGSDSVANYQAALRSIKFNYCSASNCNFCSLGFFVCPNR